MNKRTGIVLASATAILLAGGTAAVFAGNDWGPRHGGYGSHHGMHGGRGFERICSDDRDEKLARVTGLIESFVGFTPEQTTQWNALKGSLTEASVTVGVACDQIKAQGEPADPPAMLARAETAMTAGLSVLETIRPSFDAFYATLNDDQKRALTDVMKRHRRDRDGDHDDDKDAN